MKTGDSADAGNGKKLVFLEMRMLHLPDSMAAFLTGDNILSPTTPSVSTTRSGTLQRQGGSVPLYKEAMKYFANIINPYAPMLVKSSRRSRS